MSKNLQIQDALTNAEPYIHLLASMPEEKLERKLRIVHSQMDIAWKNNQTESLELLALWEKQIIEARLLKEEENTETLVSELEQEIAAVETFIDEPTKRVEETQDFLSTENNTKEEPPTLKATPQLTLF